MKRRTYLKSSVCLGTLGALAGCSFLSSGDDDDTATPIINQDDTETEAFELPKETATPEASHSRYGITFESVVNAVDDLGLDPRGREPIDDVLIASQERGNMLIEFPPGKYLFEEEPSVDIVNNWGIRGLGKTPSDVRFVTTPGEGRSLVYSDGGSGQLVENVTLDYSAKKNGSLGLVMRGNDKIRVQDVHFVGFNPTDGDGAVNNLVPMALDPDGTVIVDGLVRTGPTDIVSHGHLDGNSNEGCIWLGDRHKGTLIIRNSHISNTGTNAIYASRTLGRVHILDSLFENNNQTTLRVGGKGALVQNCEFVLDTEQVHPDNGGELINPHGIIWETGRFGFSGGRIESCTFKFRNAPDRTNAAVWVDGSAGAFEIVDCRFEIDADGVQAIRVDDPRDPRLGIVPDRPWNATIRNISATGSSNGDPIIEINGRPGSVIEGGCISWSKSRDGILIRDSDNSSIKNVAIDVAGRPITKVDSELNIQQISDSTDCDDPTVKQSQDS